MAQQGVQEQAVRYNGCNPQRNDCVSGAVVCYCGLGSKGCEGKGLNFQSHLFNMQADKEKDHDIIILQYYKIKNLYT